MTEYRTFETERLVMRPTTVEDAEFILKLFNTPKWIRFIGDRNIRTVDDASTYIKDRIIPQQIRLGYSTFTIIRKADNSKIGTCGLYDREGLAGIDIGFAFLPEFEKQGYALESAVCIRNAAFTTFGLEEVNAITVKENTDSRRLLEKLGMKNIGTTRINNQGEELMLFRIEKMFYEQMQGESGPIVVEQLLSKPADIVWEAITNVEMMRQWFFNNIPSFSPVEGFETKFAVHSGDRVFTHLWRILTVMPERMIRYSWKYEEYEGEGVVTFELIPIGNQTLFRLTNEGLDSFPSGIAEFERGSCQAGWEYFIKKNLNEYMSRG